MLIKYDKFHWLYSYIKRTTIATQKKLNTRKKITKGDIERVFTCIDLYITSHERHNTCLLRSVGGYILLQLHGAAPQFVIGVCVKPFKAHAWVEVDGEPVCEYYETVTTYKKIL